MSKDKLKELYTTGDYVCYMITTSGVFKLRHCPYKKQGQVNLKLIYKKHEAIADRLIANPSLKVEFLAVMGNYSQNEQWAKCSDFFRDYESFATYIIVEEEHTINSMEDLDNLPLVTPECENCGQYGVHTDEPHTFLSHKTTCDGKWNGCYIEAIEEVFYKLIDDGYKHYVYDTKDPDLETIWYRITTDGVILELTGDTTTEELKRFYLVDGEFTEQEPKEVECYGCNDEGCGFCEEDLNELPILGEEDERTITGACYSTFDKSMETINITDSDGKVYEFEKPEFECELLKVSRLGIIAEISLEDEFESDFVLFNHDGLLLRSLDGYSYAKDCNLTPIAKEWYEDESNFNAFMHNGDADDVAWTIVTDKQDALNMSKLGWRLATKQEVESLHYEGKS